MKEIRIHSVYDQPTVFHLTQYKCGSQWVAEILKWCAYRRCVLPEEGSQHVNTETLIQGLVYPTVYLPKDKFEAILARNKHITDIKPFVVTRDMRDVLVSFYYSLKNSHVADFKSVDRNRKNLNELSQEDGLIYLLEGNGDYPSFLSQQLSWINSSYPIFHYEDLIADEYEMFKKILSYCEIDVEPAHYEMVLTNNSFSTLTRGRKKGREDVTSHFRKGVAGDWQRHFTPKVKALFKERFGEQFVASGYVENNTW